MEDPQKFNSAALGLELVPESDLPSLATKVGVLMSTNTEIAQGILSALSAKEVIRLQRLCRLWRSVGIKELQRRKNLHFISIPSPPCEPEKDNIRIQEREYKNVLQTENRLWSWAETWRSLPSFCLVLSFMCEFDAEKMLADSKLLPPTCSIIEVRCGMDFIYTDEGLIHDQTVDYPVCGYLDCPNWISQLRKLPKLPKLPSSTLKLLLETDNTDAHNIDNSIANHGAETPPDVDKSLVPSLRQEQLMVKAMLKKARSSCARCADDIDFQQANRGVTSFVQINADLELTDQLAMICFPKLTGVTFRPLKFHRGIILPGENLTEIHGTWDGCLPWEDRVRAVLFFHDNFLSPPRRYLEALIEREQGNVAVVGSMVKGAIPVLKPNLRLQHPSWKANGTIGMAVCGENVTAASVVITARQKKENENMTRDAISKFLKFYDPCKRSGAFFTFAHVGKHDEDKGPGFELNMFKRIYPATPVFGALIVNAQTCFEFLPHPHGSVEWQLQQEKRDIYETPMAMGWIDPEEIEYCTTTILFLQF
ncbi:uncharacterized protein LOC108667170 isoform X2 [Hyalella azteca]|uniref:Uncharacterized protein LOC108667170 isoform X2 n=1 Tax=Hyalella azteca TaxID=294128 RepID=A0A8B7N8N5_HYAAZ|nr:uncharacterized protein LOC108667170 isoform X2 [Hyalella azteca]